MRTTLAIDDDVLAAAKLLALRERKPIGAVISSLARQALRPTPMAESHTRNGIPLLPLRGDGGPVALELVNRLRDSLP